MSGTKLFENEKGYAIDETDEKRIKVYEYTVGDYECICFKCRKCKRYSNLQKGINK
jgi:hypothetical protein